MVVFMIIGKGEPIYEAEIQTVGSSTDELSYLHQFILHSSLDMLNSVIWSNQQAYLKVIDKFNALLISAYATPGGSIFLLLHNGKNEDVLRNYFLEVADIYVKHIMNPFTIHEKPIVSPSFDIQVRQCAKKYLG